MAVIIPLLATSYLLAIYLLLTLVGRTAKVTQSNSKEIT